MECERRRVMSALLFCSRGSEEEGDRESKKEGDEKGRSLHRADHRCRGRVYTHTKRTQA